MRLIMPFIIIALLCLSLVSTSHAIEIDDNLETLISQAKSGDSVAAFKYAERLQRGLPGKKPDFKLAGHWYKIAAQQGVADAAIILAELYEKRKVTPPTKTATKEMYEYAYRLLVADAEKGRPSAATRLGLMFFHGQGVKADANLAIKWLQRGVDLGSAQAKLTLGRLTIWNTTPGYNSEQALEMLNDAADAGQGSAWLIIGLHYSGAFGGRLNHPRAVDAFKKAHESKTNSEGTRQYGLAFITGFGTPKDTAKGAELIKNAALRGNSEAMYNLALLYRTGTGVPKNKADEILWLKKASAYKVPDADYYLATAYRDGYGVAKDKIKALEYFKRAQIKKHVVAIRDYNELAGITAQEREAEKLAKTQKAADSKLKNTTVEPEDAEIEME